MKMENKETIELKISWIVGLKYYTNKVRETSVIIGCPLNDCFLDNVKHKTAIISLLGYLESLEILIKK